ncbi:hypothetical protein C5B42_04630 [Candidatus Cerribacteria bacterium 'Amazon FNV 2010 28 9']|uniref:Uncharacterized protein n=1 Tax=Candidatus Cerribacteria bacterium 'Amazon FNV 2010 28 9' TaxID=2081795 RepID=A0A317JMN4_9BACT|nr:MAG: hypothetical protein C5B42_04630 [Candidatus Cerribacteria bacterium 'Amazon FNV 2010 28 9']
MSGDNAKLILMTVAENPGKMKRQDILQLFGPEDQHSVAITLGRLLGPQSQRLKEKNGFLLLGKGNEEIDEDDNTEKEILPAPSLYLTMPFRYEEAIELPEMAKGRSIDVIFEVTLRVRAAKRVGIATSMNKNSIFWLPPGSNVLKARLGEYDVSPEMELMQGNFLAIVIKKGVGFVVQYFQAPNEERFALAWADEE